MDKLCSVDGCEKPIVNSRGWCNAHYKRWRRHGDPLAGRTPEGEPERYLREVVMAYDGDDCLIWPFANYGDGRAAIWLDGHVRPVSRIVCEDRNGPPPTCDHEAAHGCGHGNSGCVSRRHLRWATHLENEADKKIHGTLPIGERNGSTKLQNADVAEICALKGRATQQEIADRFGVSRQIISHIHCGKRSGFELPGMKIVEIEKVV